MLQDQKLTFLKQVNGLDFYRFHCSLFHYFYTPLAYYEKLFTRKIRESIDFLRGGYSVIYMFLGDTPVGYGVITRGGARNRFCTNKDSVLCSIWVEPDYRGRGYSKVLIGVLSEIASETSENIYEYINLKNTPSIRAAEANGFRREALSRHVGLLQSVVISKDGPLGIFRRVKQEDQMQES